MVKKISLVIPLLTLVCADCELTISSLQRQGFMENIFTIYFHLHSTNLNKRKTFILASYYRIMKKSSDCFCCLFERKDISIKCKFQNKVSIQRKSIFLCYSGRFANIECTRFNATHVHTTTNSKISLFTPSSSPRVSHFPERNSSRCINTITDNDHSMIC